MRHGVSRMAFLVTSVSVFYSFIPTFMKPETYNICKSYRYKLPFSEETPTLRNMLQVVTIEDAIC